MTNNKDNSSLKSMKESAQQASALLKAMANENRLMILCYLQDKELSVTELNSYLDLSQSALSQHLAILRRDGLVETRRESQTIFYKVSCGNCQGILKTLYGLFCAD